MPSKNSNSAVKRQITEIALMTLDSKDQDLANIVKTSKGDILICKSYEDFTTKREKADPNKETAVKTKKIVPFSISSEVIYLLVFLLQLLLRPDNEQLYTSLKAAIGYISDDKLQLSCHKIDDFLTLSEFKEINTPLNRREILIIYTKFIIYICNKIITDIIIFKKKVSVTSKLLFNIITDLSNIKNCNIFEELYVILKEHINSIPKITKNKKKAKIEIHNAEDANDDEDTEDANEDEDTEDADDEVEDANEGEFTEDAYADAYADAADAYADENVKDADADKNVKDSEENYSSSSSDDDDK